MNEAIAEVAPRRARRRTAPDAGRRSCAPAAPRCARRSSSVPTRRRLLRGHTRLVDRIVASIWRELGAPADIALVAVGGYGRGELFPHSDVDVLILLPGWLDPAGTAFVERLIGVFWDIGLEMGHSVRTIAQCTDEMAADITVKTSLLEHRFVAGSRQLASRLRPQRRRGDGHSVVLRSEDAGTAAAASQVSRHGLQPRAEREGEPRRPARPADRAVDRARGRRGPRLARARAGRAHHDAGSANRVAAGAAHRRAAGAASLSVGPARGPAGVRPAECARARTGARRHACAARERAADAALLPRRQDRAAGERHPAAEPACAAVCRRRPSRCRSTTSSSRSTSSCTCATRRCSSAGRRRCSMRF